MTLRVMYEHTEGGYGMILTFDDCQLKWLSGPGAVRITELEDGWWQVENVELSADKACVLKKRNKRGSSMSARQHVARMEMPHHGCMTLCVRYCMDAHGQPILEFYEREPAINSMELPVCPEAFSLRAYGGVRY